MYAIKKEVSQANNQSQIFQKIEVGNFTCTENSTENIVFQVDEILKHFILALRIGVRFQGKAGISNINFYLENCCITIFQLQILAFS